MRDARNPGCVCPQAADVGRRAAGTDELLPYSEDCLVLNVWTKGLADGQKLPVMVWLHGRGFYAGAGSEPLYDGTNLARQGDVVVVTKDNVDETVIKDGFLRREDVYRGGGGGGGGGGQPAASGR